MGPLHHQVAATMVPLLAARPIASTADFSVWSPAALTDQSLALRKSQNAGSNGRSRASPAWRTLSSPSGGSTEPDMLMRCEPNRNPHSPQSREHLAVAPG